MRDVLKVIGTARLAADPDLRTLDSGIAVCKLRIAWSTSRKNQASGQWEDKPNFADLTVWGAQGEACARFLSKGRQIIFEARLEHRQWETPEGQKRSALDLVADQVQFVGSGDRDGNGGGNGAGGGSGDGFTAAADANFQAAPATSGAAGDDIPF